MNQSKPEKKGPGSGRGGARPGSGRKPGSANKRTREIADRAAAEGITPLEVMLKTMNALIESATICNDKQEGAAALSLLLQASAVAKDAAPYMHPRLAAIEHAGKDGAPLQAPPPIFNISVKA